MTHVTNSFKAIDNPSIEDLDFYAGPASEIESEDGSDAPKVCPLFIHLCTYTNLCSQIKAEPASPSTAVKHSDLDNDVFMSIDFTEEVWATGAREASTSAGSLFAPGREDAEEEEADNSAADDSVGADDPGVEVHEVTSGSSEDADFVLDPIAEMAAIEEQAVVCRASMVEMIRRLDTLLQSIRKCRESEEEE